MQDQTPIVGWPRGANGRALQAEGIVWEGQVLIAGDGIDLAARLIVTADRIAFARGGVVALDAPRAWLRPAPSLLPDDSIRFTLAPGDGSSEVLQVLTSEGRREAARLVALLAGSDTAASSLTTNGHGSRYAEAERPSRPPSRPAPTGEPFPDPPPAPPARRVSAPEPERWGTTPDLNTLAVLDPDDFPTFSSRPRPSSRPVHEFDPLPPWHAAEEGEPAPSRFVDRADRADTRGAQLPWAPAGAGEDGGIPRHTAWLQPIDLQKPNRRGRAGWAIRLSGLVLLLVAAAMFGTGNFPDNPGRDLASRLPAQTRDTLGIETDDPTPTPTSSPQPTPAPTGQPTAPQTVADTIWVDPTAPPEPTAQSLGVGGETAAAEGEAPTATVTATLTPEPPVPTPTPTTEPAPTEPPPPPPTPTATPEPEIAASGEENEEIAEPTSTSTPEPPDPTATPTEEPPTATTEPTAEPTAEPTSTPTEEPAAAPTATPEPAVAPTESPTVVPTETAEPSATATATATAIATVTATTAVSPVAAPTATPGRIPPQAATLGEGETPPPVVADGAFRYTITAAMRGAELPDLALPATPGVEWVVLLLTAQNWAPQAATMSMGDFRLGVSTPAEATVPIDATSSAVAQFLGYVPAYRSSDAVLFAPGEIHQLALVFLVDPAASDLDLLTGETTIALDNVIGTGSPAVTASAPELLDGTVVEVIDGQTILVDVDGQRGLVRYSGITAPSGGDCYAAESTEANRDLVERQSVWLERQRRNTAGDDALTRDVWVATEGGGRQLVSAMLVSQGAATPAIKAPDTRFAAWLEAARGQAEADGAGLWGACGGPAEATPNSTSNATYLGGWQRRAFGWNERYG